MLIDDLHSELLAMREEDLRVRQELLDAGELGGAYVPRMEAVHVKNVARLRELIGEVNPQVENLGDESLSSRSL